MVRELGPVTPTADLAEQLNAAGMVTGNGRPFDVKAVQWIRHAYHIPAPAACADGEISVAEAARRLGCSTGVIYYWIETAQLNARRGPGNRLCITWNDQVETACRDRIAESGHLNPAARRTRPRRHAKAAENVGAICHAHITGSADTDLTSTNQRQSRTSRHAIAGGAV